ncbi:hypothetical protein RMCBS344292_17900 [Rhizopus microsporus]|nr:hypothetical protein RMCBS344292_17900 [Rhizopus microsporus]
MTTSILEELPVNKTMLGSPVVEGNIVQLKEEKKKKKNKKKNNSDPKPIREAVGAIVIDSINQKILMIESRKNKDTFVLPRDDCHPQEHPEKAAIRLLHDKAGIDTNYLSKRVGCFSESNKKGRVVAHHWMYEVHNPKLLDNWPESNRKRVWMIHEEALKASENKRMAYLALQKINFDNLQ